MSLVTMGRHYIRDGMGSEQLYDLKGHRLESENLMDSREGKQIAGLFRRMLLDALTENPGSIVAENAYLKPYRQWLKSLVEQSPVRDGPNSAAGLTSNEAGK